MTTPMGIPTKEELEQQQEEREQPTAETTPSSEPSTSPTPDTPPTSTDKEDERDSLLRQQMAIISSMRQQLDDLTQKSNAPPVPAAPSQDDLNKKFWEDPVSVIRHEMEAMVAPIKEQLGKTAKKDAYVELKDRFRADPRFKMVIEKAEPYIDQLMAKQQPTEANLQAVIYGIRGAAALGDVPIQFDDPTPTPTPTPKKADPSMLPPHLRPSAPQAPKGEEKKQVRQLTELEKRLARENRMSDEEYLQMMELKPEEVVNYKKESK